MPKNSAGYYHTKAQTFNPLKKSNPHIKSGYQDTE
jgi:hypothetical protein